MEGKKLEIKEHILAVLADNKNKIEFETLLEGTEEKPGSVREAARALISEGKVMSSKNGKLFLPGSFGMFTGRLEVKRLGFAFLLDVNSDWHYAGRGGSIDDSDKFGIEFKRFE